MDLKKKLKRFFTLTRKANDGFTLVELIIVIAILAILAGAAVPAYNGYTKKAREAADQMIVAAANDAFAAACMENKVDAMNVTEATVSVLEGKVYGLSSATYNSDASFVDKTAPYFLTYFEGNGEMVFQTPGINSLIWNDTLDSFEMSADFVATRVVLSNGKSITVSAEDMALIMASAYADMGYSGIRDAINNVSKSGTLLAEVAGGLGMMDKLTNAMLSYGLISEEKAAELQNALKVTNAWKNPDAYAAAAQESANGLQMITAKYLASGNADLDELLNIKLTSSTSMLTSMTGSGGTKTVTAAALQYALVESFANNDEYKDTTITYKDGWTTKTSTVAEYLASDAAKDDPIKAMATVQATDAYKSYATSDQFTADKNGFVGTMSLLGDNVGSVNKDGTVKNEGAISPDSYLSSGINGAEAEDVLTSILGK